MALATAYKGVSSISEYFTKIKVLVDEMTSASKKLEDELVSYILAGLDLEFNPVVSCVAAQVEPILVGELYTQLVNFEQRMELHGGRSSSSINMVTKGGRGNGSNPHERDGSLGSSHGKRGGCCGGRNQGNSSGVICQLYGKEGHAVLRCYKRFDASFTPEEELPWLRPPLDVRH